MGGFDDDDALLDGGCGVLGGSVGDRGGVVSTEGRLELNGALESPAEKAIFRNSR